MQVIFNCTVIEGDLGSFGLSLCKGREGAKTSPECHVKYHGQLPRTSANLAYQARRGPSLSFQLLRGKIVLGAFIVKHPCGGRCLSSIVSPHVQVLPVLLWSQLLHIISIMPRCLGIVNQADLKVSKHHRGPVSRSTSPLPPVLASSQSAGLTPPTTPS